MPLTPAGARWLQGLLVMRPKTFWWAPITWFAPSAIRLHETVVLGIQGPLETGQVRRRLGTGGTEGGCIGGSVVLKQGHGAVGMSLYSSVVHH